MSQPAHHFSLHQAAAKKRATHTVDALAYTVGIGGNAATIPQIIKAWQSNAPGLAVLTWLLFVCFGFVWLVYALLHRQRPLIVAQTVGIAANMAVICGWLVNNWLH